MCVIDLEEMYFKECLWNLLKENLKKAYFCLCRDELAIKYN